MRAASTTYTTSLLINRSSTDAYSLLQRRVMVSSCDIYRIKTEIPFGRSVPPGQISRNTFKFLVNLQDPEKNDREWFKMREPAYRLAEQVSLLGSFLDIVSDRILHAPNFCPLRNGKISSVS